MTRAQYLRQTKNTQQNNNSVDDNSIPRHWHLFVIRLCGNLHKYITHVYMHHWVACTTSIATISTKCQTPKYHFLTMYRVHRTDKQTHTHTHVPLPYGCAIEFQFIHRSNHYELHSTTNYFALDSCVSRTSASSFFLKNVSELME